MPDLPHWQPLDGAPLAAPAPGRVVAVVATERAVSEGWAPQAALELARAWARNGTRVVLADAALTHPSLHAAGGVPNREGLTDAALFGASLERVSHLMDGDGFLLVTAGTPVADPGAVARDPRWHRILGGMAEAGAVLVVYLHAGAGSTAAFLGSASDIVVLSGPDETSPPVLRDLEPLVRAIAGHAEAMPHADPVVSTDTEEPALAGADPDSGGFGRMALFLILAVVVAAALGYLLTSGVG